MQEFPPELPRDDRYFCDRSPDQPIARGNRRQAVNLGIFRLDSLSGLRLFGEVSDGLAADLDKYGGATLNSAEIYRLALMPTPRLTLMPTPLGVATHFP